MECSYSLKNKYILKNSSRLPSPFPPPTKKKERKILKTPLKMCLLFIVSFVIGDLHAPTMKNSLILVYRET